MNLIFACLLTVVSANYNYYYYHYPYHYGYTSDADCALPWYKGDGSCDDENNVAECEYDGGDCCGLYVDTTWCSECACIDPGYNSTMDADCAQPSWKDDGSCDDDNNVPECDYDGGDCCGDDVVTTYCTECSCKEGIYEWSHFGVDEACNHPQPEANFELDKGLRIQTDAGVVTLGEDEDVALFRSAQHEATLLGDLNVRGKLYVGCEDIGAKFENLVQSYNSQISALQEELSALREALNNLGR